MSSSESSAGKKMSIAERMMAKMGYVQGQGLGRDNSGIVNPIEAATTINRAGIGHEGGMLAAEALTYKSENRFEISSKWVAVSNLDPYSEAAFIYSMFDYNRELRVKIKEIYTHAGNAYIEFENEEDAEESVSLKDQAQFGQNGRRISVQLIAPEHLPECPKSCFRLSDFLCERANMIPTTTVLFTKLHEHHELSWLNELLDDPYQDEDEDEDEDGVKYKRFLENDRGSALVRFGSVDGAVAAVDEWSGCFFKSRTIYAKCVLDSELDNILEDERRRKEKPKSALIVTNVPQGVDAEYIHKLFRDYEIIDVNFPPRGGSAIAFLAAADAQEILRKYPNGIVFEKRKIWVNEFQGKKGTKKGIARPARTNMDTLANQASTLSIKSAEVIVRSLSYQATEQDVRRLFNDFTVNTVSLKKGFAFIGLTSKDEAERAIRQLNERKLLGRKVYVEAVRPKQK